LYERLPALRLGSPAAWRGVINLALLAECLSEVGDVERGLTVLDAIPPEHRELILAPEIRRVHGELLLRRNEHLRQHFLTDLRNHRFGCPFLTKAS
jgi:hypothetical protein